MTSLTIQTYIQEINVDPVTQAVSFVLAGPRGPVGAQGPPGSNGAAIAYYHTQVALNSSWLINHDLGFRPNITVEEAGTGYEIMCAEIHHTVNQVELQFNTPRAGTARLS